MFHSLFTEPKAKTKREEVLHQSNQDVVRLGGAHSCLRHREGLSQLNDCIHTQIHTHKYCTHNQPGVRTQSRTHTLWKIIATIAMHYHRHSLGEPKNQSVNVSAWACACVWPFMCKYIHLIRCLVIYRKLIPRHFWGIYTAKHIAVWGTQTPIDGHILLL